MFRFLFGLLLGIAAGYTFATYIAEQQKTEAPLHE
jgi:hypothetical protein